MDHRTRRACTANAYRERFARCDGVGVAALKADPERHIAEFLLHDFTDHRGLVAIRERLKRHHRVWDRSGLRGALQYDVQLALVESLWKGHEHNTQKKGKRKEKGV